MPMSRVNRWISCLSLWLLMGAPLAISGCQAEIDGIMGKEKPGIDPPMGRFFYPTGVALTPEGRYLVVTNGNADLKYNGGTVSVVDLVETMRRINDPGSYGGSCRYAPQDPLIVECQEAETKMDGVTIPGLILKDLTIRTGFYPGFIILEDLTEGAWTPWVPERETPGVRRYRLYTLVRGDPSVTFVDMIMSSDQDDAEVLCLDCGEGCDGDELRDCKDSFRIETASAGRDDFLASDALPAEPYGLGLEAAGGFMVLVHLVGGNLSLIDLVGYQGDLRRGGPDVVDVLMQVMGQDAEGRSGGFNVVARTPGDPLGWFYISNRAAAQIVTVRVAGGDVAVAEDRGLRLVLGQSIVLTAPYGPLESGADMRGMAMSPDGNRLYALSRTPPSLLVVDTTLENGLPRNEVIDVVEVCPKPSVLKVRQGPLGRTLAYAVCYGSGEIYVVDTEDAQVVDRIEAGGGPHDLVLVPDVPGIPDVVRGHGFVTNFGEHTVGVIDLRETSPNYHQMIGRIGWPEEMQQ